MWQWLSVPILLFASSGFGMPVSSGPTSNEEANVLWRTGVQAIQEFRFQDAVNSFERYVDRYPGSPNYLKAHYFLGKAFIEQNANSKAVTVLKSFVTASKAPTDSAEGRLLLGHAYLNLRKFQEAYLITLEVDQIDKNSTLSSDILLEALLIKSEALLGLHHLDRATQVLDSVDKQLSDKNSSTVKGQVFELQLKLKISDCARLPSRDRLDEGQLRAQLDRRGICLLESLLIYHKILNANDLRSAASATTQVVEAFDQYAKSCKQSYSPSEKIKRSKQELHRYEAELSDRLSFDCKHKWTSALDLLDSWKLGLPPAMMGALLQTSQNLGNFISRAP